MSMVNVLKECLKSDPPLTMKVGPLKLDASFASSLLDTAELDVGLADYTSRTLTS